MTLRVSIFGAALFVGAIAFTACENKTPNTEAKAEVQDTLATGKAKEFRIAFVYGDTLDEKYNFLIDARSELEEEGKVVDERLRRKLSRAEARARELQQQAATMTQTQMQEAQLELQSLDLEMQQFQEKLSTELREREMELQKEYVAKVDSFLANFNAERKYDYILNYQRGGNILLVNDAFDITDEVLKGLNDAYDRDLAAASDAAADTEKK